jgi:gamma-glutamyltranspeptidase/glutathione hydrolase
MGRAAVVANHPLAAMAGIRTLMAGGNAIDAAVTVGFAIGVAEPNGSGIGGDGYVMVHRAGEAGVHVANGTGASPLGVTAKTPIARTGLTAASVPGIVDAMLAAHARWGRLPLAQCIEPAAELAEAGVPVSHFQAQMTAKYPALHQGEAAKIFAPAGAPLPAGAIRRNADLAASYRLIAREGRDGFYRGPIAAAMVAAGDWFQPEDFRRHHTRIDPAITTDYRGYTVCEAPPNSSGITLLQMLNLIEQFPIGEMRALSAEAIHLMVEAKRLAFIDREAYLGDLETVAMPITGLLSKAYAAERARLIDPTRAAETVRPGNAWIHDPDGAGHSAPAAVRLKHRDGDTTHFCIVDGEGNAVGQLQSLNMMFGAQIVVPGTGMLLNNRMTYWHVDQDHPNALTPGVRVRHTMNPVMVFAGDRLRWVLGTPGGDTQVQSNLQTLSALIDHGFTEAEAVQSARWSHHESGTYSNHPHLEENELQIETRVGDATLAELAARGHHLRPDGPWGARGSVGIIGIDPVSGARLAAADLRRDGQALVI